MRDVIRLTHWSLRIQKNHALWIKSDHFWEFQQDLPFPDKDFCYTIIVAGLLPVKSIEQINACNQRLFFLKR
jgi:hypothetical protein